MRLIISLLFLAVAVNAQSTEPPGLEPLALERSSAKSPSILIFGDSLSAGFGLDVNESWVALLQLRLKRQGYEHRVINASISGETTEGGATRIESALEDFSPDLVILELGANDGLRGLPTARMTANLETIITSAKSSGAAVVLLGIRIPSNYGPRYSTAFENVFQQVALDHDIGWIEFFMEGVALNDDLLQDDRFHPNAAAQSTLLDNAWPIIRDALRQSLAHK